MQFKMMRSGQKRSGVKPPKNIDIGKFVAYAMKSDVLSRLAAKAPSLAQLSQRKRLSRIATVKRRLDALIRILFPIWLILTVVLLLGSLIPLVSRHLSSSRLFDSNSYKFIDPALQHAHQHSSPYCPQSIRCEL